MPTHAAIAGAVQWVVLPGGGPRVRLTTLAVISGGRGGMRDGRVLSRRRRSTSASMNRSCQRQTESLVIPFDCSSYRTATPWAPGGPTLRLQIGLEDIENLKADLAAGFKRLASYTPTADPG